jgi:aspartyl protease family protein
MILCNVLRHGAILFVNNRGLGMKKLTAGVKRSAWFSQFNGGVVFVLVSLLPILLMRVFHSSDNPNLNPVATVTAAGTVQVVLKPNHIDQYVVSGAINGEPVEFLIDTGSADVALSHALAQRLRLALTPGGVSMTGNGNVDNWSAWLDQVNVGGFVAARVKATVLPNLPGERVLLGMSYLKHLELTLAHGALTLRPSLGITQLKSTNY